MDCERPFRKVRRRSTVMPIEYIDINIRMMTTPFATTPICDQSPSSEKSIFLSLLGDHSPRSFVSVPKSPKLVLLLALLAGLLLAALGLAALPLTLLGRSRGRCLGVRALLADLIALLGRAASALLGADLRQRLVLGLDRLPHPLLGLVDRLLPVGRVVEQRERPLPVKEVHVDHGLEVLGLEGERLLQVLDAFVGHVHALLADDVSDAPGRRDLLLGVKLVGLGAG